MLRSCNLIPKYLTDKIKNAANHPKSEAKVAAATPTNTIPNKSERPQGTREREVRASKSALSSLSFSTFGDSYADDDNVAKENSDGRRIFASSHGQNVQKAPSFGTSTLLKTTKLCQGRLVARTLPKKFADYSCHKPATRIDPTDSIAVLEEWQKEHEISSGVQDADGGGECIRPSEEESSLGEDEDEDGALLLDLYLLRTSFLGEQVDNNQTQTSAQREQRVNALIASYDLSRNMPSKKGISTEDSISFSTDMSAAKDDFYFSDKVFHLHMNRSSKELMTRTLRRLELSASRRLQSFHQLSSRKKSNGGKEANLALINEVTSSKLVMLDNELNDEEVNDGYAYGYNYCSEVDLVGLSSSDILSNIVSSNRVALTVPAAILPWINRDDRKEQSSDSSSSADESSCSSVNFNAVETIFIDIVHNPPTVVEVQTFENFAARNFVGVPMVAETSLVYATRAIITWFVDGNVVANDTKSYTPEEEDIGKSVSILITPVRPGHDGGGCEEKYVFMNAVEPLPSMPIMKLREEWSRVDVIARDGGNNLRVLTVSSVALNEAAVKMEQISI